MKRNKPLFMEQSKDSNAYNDWKDRVKNSSAADSLYKRSKINFNENEAIIIILFYPSTFYIETPRPFFST